MCMCFFLLQNDKTALMYASEGGHTECVEALLRRGADANIKIVNSNKVLRCVKMRCVENITQTANIIIICCSNIIQVSCDHRCCVHYWVHNN